MDAKTITIGLLVLSMLIVTLEATEDTTQESPAYNAALRDAFYEGYEESSEDAFQEGWCAALEAVNLRFEKTNVNIHLNDEMCTLSGTTAPRED